MIRIFDRVSDGVISKRPEPCIESACCSEVKRLIGELRKLTVANSRDGKVSLRLRLEIYFYKILRADAQAVIICSECQGYKSRAHFSGRAGIRDSQGRICRRKST